MKGKDDPRACHGKNRYSRKQTAMAVARRARRQGKGPIVAYECVRCAKYHIGHQPKG